MSGPKKYLRTEGAERIDQPDFEHAAEESQLSGLTQLGETFVVGSDAGQNHYVLSGFQITDGGANKITVGAGAAFLGWKDQGNVEQGVLINATAAQTITMAAALTGTPNVYIKFNLQDADFENRNFWNSLAATPVEIPRQIATRRVDSFEVTFGTSSPGTEWMELGTIAIASLTGVVGSTTGITDKRVFYFEGAVTNTYNPSNDWGFGNDRDADRSTYGIKGLRTFARAIQRQLKDIIGASSGNWFSSVPSSLTALNDDKLSRSGLNTITGNIIPDGDGTREFGSSATAFESLHSTRFAFPSDARAYNTYGAVSYRWIDVAAANISDTHGDGPPQYVKRYTSDPRSVSNPARIDAGILGSLASDVYIYFPIDLPGKYFANDSVSKTSAVYLDKVEVHLSNNSASATRGMVMRQDLSTAAMDTLHSGTAGLNWYAFVSTPGSNIGTATQLSTIDQNQAIDNSAYRYFVVIQAKASYQTTVYGVKLTYTVHNLIT